MNPFNASSLTPSTSIDTAGGLIETAELFSEVFHVSPDMDRLARSRRFVVRGTTGLQGAVAIENEGREGWHVWLFAVRPDCRNNGVGRALLNGIIAEAKENGVCVLQLKTHKEWAVMRSLLQHSGWYLSGAEFSKKRDGVSEVWRMPLLSKILEIAVIGANPRGRGGEWIERIKDLPSLWKLAAIVDASSEVRAAYEAAGIVTFENVSDMLSCIRPDAAVVAVPPGVALPIQIACLDSGLRLLVEKPFVASLSDLLDLQTRLSAMHGPRIVPGVQRRKHPGYLALKAAMADEAPESLSIRIALGRPIGRDPAGHRADRLLCRGGALIDLGYHALDLVHFLLGSPLEMISCGLRDGSDVASGIESSASLLGRAGATWVRVVVDCHGGAKEEAIEIRMRSGIWRADRETVRDPEGTVFYQCPRAWNAAETGCLVQLAIECTTKVATSTDLWEHLAVFSLIERAYSLAKVHGLEGGGS